jgi:TonB family protein
MRLLLHFAVSAFIATTATANSQPAPTAPIPMTSHRVTAADYPLKSVLLREFGTANLRYQVRQDGTVGEVEVLTSSGSRGLDEAATYLVKRWRFKPATENGNPTTAELNANIVFSLNAPLGALAPARLDVRDRNAAFRITGFTPDETEYPAQSIAAGETGSVELSYLVRDNGTVDEIQVAKSSGFARLDDAAARTIRSKWRFRPALQDGRPTASRLSSTIVFLIEPSRLRVRVLPTDPALRGTASPPRFGGGGPEIAADSVGYPYSTRVDETDTAFIIARVPPPDARIVVLDLLVSPRAQVSEVRLAQSSGDPVLDRLARLMARRLPVVPGRQDDKPAPSWARIEMNLSPGP